MATTRSIPAVGRGRWSLRKSGRRDTGTVGPSRYDPNMSSTELLDRQAAPPADAVRAALTELTHAVDALQSASLGGIDDHEVLAVFQELETQRRRMPTVDHRLITELECRGTATKLLSRGTAGLLTELLHVDVGEAKARVRAADVLGSRTSITGEPLDPVYPATAAAQAAGTISEKHARIVTTTIGALPHTLDADTTALAETTLVDQAKGLRPSELTKVAERITAYLDPDGQLSDDTDRAARRALNIGKQRADGMSPITGLLDAATRALVDAAFSTLGRPVAGRGHPGPTVGGPAQPRCTGRAVPQRPRLRRFAVQPRLARHRRDHHGHRPAGGRRRCRDHRHRRHSPDPGCPRFGHRRLPRAVPIRHRRATVAPRPRCPPSLRRPTPRPVRQRPRMHPARLRHARPVDSSASPG